MTVPVYDTELEQSLLERVQRGDGEALATLFRRYAADLHRLVYRLLGSRDDADDVVQDVFVGLRHALARYEPRGRFDVWLRRVAARTALMRLRADRRRRARAEHVVTEPRVLPVDDTALGSELARAIDALPEALRVVFVLRMIEGFSHDEIAAALDTSVGASKVRLHRALKRLQSALDHLRQDS